MCAEGGTGYNHCVSMGRSRHVDGPYERDPANPILTAQPETVNERMILDFLKPQHFNPASRLQKCGHGSYVETPAGEVYLVHLCARPFLPELRCTLGRETAMQKMEWTPDGWLRLAGGGNLAREEFEPADLPEVPVKPAVAFDDFDHSQLELGYYAPRIDPAQFTDLTSRPGHLRLRGGESLCSLNRVSLLIRKLTSVNASITAKLEFHPEAYQHSAGIVLYYDNQNYLFLRKTFNPELQQCTLIVMRLENGVKTDYTDAEIPVREYPLRFRLTIRGRKTHLEWSYDGADFQTIGPVFDTSFYSDEYTRTGQMTGAFVGIACVDSMLHRQTADFDFFDCQMEKTQYLDDGKNGCAERGKSV